jgi:hypothetical protein
MFLRAGAVAEQPVIRTERLRLQLQLLDLAMPYLQKSYANDSLEPVR